MLTTSRMHPETFSHIWVNMHNPYSDNLDISLSEFDRVSDLDNDFTFSKNEKYFYIFIGYQYQEHRFDRMIIRVLNNNALREFNWIKTIRSPNNGERGPKSLNGSPLISAFDFTEFEQILDE